MADNFLERRRDDYEKRKARWLKKSSRFPVRRPGATIADGEADTKKTKEQPTT